MHRPGPEKGGAGAGRGRPGQGRTATYLKMKRMVAPASLLPSEGKLMSRTLRPTCLATAFAIMVLPTPLAPWNSSTSPPVPPTAPKDGTCVITQWMCSVEQSILTPCNTAVQAMFATKVPRDQQMHEEDVGQCWKHKTSTLATIRSGTVGNAETAGDSVYTISTMCCTSS